MEVAYSQGHRAANRVYVYTHARAALRHAYIRSARAIIRPRVSSPLVGIRLGISQQMRRDTEEGSRHTLPEIIITINHSPPRLTDL